MRFHLPALPLAGLALVPLVALEARADDITDQLQLAIELYEEGDYAATVTELQYAIGEIQAKLGDALREPASRRPLPAGAPPRPTREAGAAFLGGGTIVNREYTRGRRHWHDERPADHRQPDDPGHGGPLQQPGDALRPTRT